MDVMAALGTGAGAILFLHSLSDFPTLATSLVNRGAFTDRDLARLGIGWPGVAQSDAKNVCS